LSVVVVQHLPVLEVLEVKAYLLTPQLLQETVVLVEVVVVLVAVLVAHM
jgi:hypothetical protein